MSIKIIQERLNSYKCESRQEEENAVREITQEVALLCLYNADFFKRAAFQGGACLRIFYGTNRFSEDLDFALIAPDPRFGFSNYLENLKKGFEAYGYTIEIQDRAKTKGAVKTLFLKDDSLGKIIDLTHPTIEGRARSIKIKLEIDCDPPSGAKIENKFHDFPLNFSVTAHDLPSLFATKSHALLCREYTKGRDWYDFLWYAGRKVGINFELLSNAIDQQGPWQGQNIKVDKKWYLEEMAKKIESTDWEEAKQEVQRFLRPIELKALELWNSDLFLASIAKLGETLQGRAE